MFVCMYVGMYVYIWARHSTGQIRFFAVAAVDAAAVLVVLLVVLLLAGAFAHVKYTSCRAFPVRATCAQEPLNFAYTYTYTYTCMYVCMHACMHVYTHAYTYVRACLHE